MCARLGILLPKQIHFLKNLNELLLFREVTGLGCRHRALSVAVQGENPVLCSTNAQSGLWVGLNRLCLTWGGLWSEFTLRNFWLSHGVAVWAGLLPLWGSVQWGAWLRWPLGGLLESWFPPQAQPAQPPHAQPPQGTLLNKEPDQSCPTGSQLRKHPLCLPPLRSNTGSQLLSPLTF